NPSFSVLRQLQYLCELTQQASRMDFLKAVLLAVLIHIVAPLVVRYVDSNFPTHCVNQTHGGAEGTGDGHR
ncbi:hypothetical protein, partial [Pluralibacter gergoviae]